jgi:septum formation protein
LVLASRSPQRRAILEQLGIAFEIRPADTEERTAGPAEEVVTENALEKARAAARGLEGERVVLGVDTEVVLDGLLYGKAAGADEARAYLSRLSGRSHEVWSGIALVEKERQRVAATCTTVTFRDLGDEIIDWYLASGEWRERAGAYAIQGKGAAFVRRIEGDYWNVVGLPVALLIDIAPEIVEGTTESGASLTSPVADT